MNWIKENKFLTGFFAAMLFGAGVFGYLLFSAMGSFDEATARYTGLATELNRLQNLPVSPSQKNLAVLTAQKKEAVEVIAAFQSSLAAKSFPTEAMTPEQFQDKLKATKTAVVEKAQGNPKLPDKFFLAKRALVIGPVYISTVPSPAPTRDTGSRNPRVQKESALSVITTPTLPSGQQPCTRTRPGFNTSISSATIRPSAANDGS